MVVIRKIRADEGQRLRAIRVRAISDAPSAFGSTLDDTLARTDAYWDARVTHAAVGDESVLFVAENLEGWVGLVGGYLEDFAVTASVKLISMWVAPASRGQGIGRKLVEQIIVWARQRPGAQHVSLWVTENNAAAIALYERCGFRSTGETQPLPLRSDLLEQRMVLNL